MKAKIGDRVFAVASANHNEVELYGFGVYNGLGFHPELNIANPQTTLDNDKGVVWGFECWWGRESAFNEFVGSRKVVEAPLRTYPTQTDITTAV